MADLDLGVPVQYGYVVRDLDKAIAAWRDRVELGPFFVFENISVENAIYRGKPLEFELTAALAQSGSVQIELLFQHSALPSALTEGDTGSLCRLHHIGFLSNDAEGAVDRLRANGHEVALEGLAFGDMPFAYVDTLDSLGHMVEISPARPSAVAMFETVRDAAINWDGRDPVRRFRPGTGPA